MPGRTLGVAWTRSTLRNRAESEELEAGEAKTASTCLALCFVSWGVSQEEGFQSPDISVS